MTITLGSETGRAALRAYFMSADGYLMPARKNQAPPDLRYFKQTQK
jgi:hypothetical protein